LLFCGSPVGSSGGASCQVWPDSDAVVGCLRQGHGAVQSWDRRTIRPGLVGRQALWLRGGCRQPAGDAPA